MNLLGVKKVIDLCKELKDLHVFIHISTAYANCNRPHISEEVYVPPVKPESIMEAMSWMDDDLVINLTHKLIGKWPNTYTFTKAIAEYLVYQECKNIPCAIVRPSIVTGTWREPVEGWVDNFNGPTALFPACGAGILRTMIGHRGATADLVPVDIPVNLIIASAWYTGSAKSNKMIVYNCTSGQINRLTWGEMERMTKPQIFENPFCNIFMYPNPKFTSNR
jgi:fatty acyl-CoA reductase